jgi:glycosyltransferase involved in cell wall biosynthesis
VASDREWAGTKGGGAVGLRVAALAFPLAAKVWGGISWATYRTVEAVSRVDPDSTFHLVFYEEPGHEFGRGTVDRLVSDRANLEKVVVPKGKEAIRWCEENADVVWGPASGILRTKKVPQVFTHHDMRMFGNLRESYTHYIKHRAGLNHAMKEAKVAVTVSLSTQQETLARYGGAKYAAKTCTVPWGVPAGFDDADDVEPMRPDFIEGGRFISCIYDPFPHKRMDLLERVTPLLDEHGWDLVIMGGMRGEGVDMVLDHPRVHYPGFVDYDLLPRYIKASSLFLFPSEYEGFGFPPYEAMALDVPVLYNRRCQALSVVVGDQSWSFSKDEDMVPLLGQLMDRYEMRKHHVEEARKLVRRFDWDLCGRRYMYLFETAHDHRSGRVDFTTGDPALPVEAIISHRP